MFKRIPFGRTLPVVSLVAYVATSAMGAAALTIDEIANLSGPDRAKIVLEGAKKEGTVLLYTGRTSAVLNDFSKRHPYIRVETRQGSAPDHVRRMTEEYSAGHYYVDVVATSNGGLHVLKDKGLA